MCRIIFFIYIEQYLWWHLCIEMMLPTSAYYLITLDHHLKWGNDTPRSEIWVPAPVHADTPCVFHCLVPVQWTCPRPSCGFRLWASTQAVVSICSALCLLSSLASSRLSLSVASWKGKFLSSVQLFATPWVVVHGILQARILEWVDEAFTDCSEQSFPLWPSWTFCTPLSQQL